MSKIEYKLMISELVISSSMQGGNPVYGETVTKIALQDDCGGCFLEIKQAGNDWNGEMDQCIRLDEDEIPALIKALQVMQKELETAGELDKLREAK